MVNDNDIKVIFGHPTAIIFYTVWRLVHCGYRIYQNGLGGFGVNVCMIDWSQLFPLISFVVPMMYSAGPVKSDTAVTANWTEECTIT